MSKVKLSLPIVPVILAAGEGKRMRSKIPKPLQPLLEKPLIRHLLDTLLELQMMKPQIVVGYQANAIREALIDYEVDFVIQNEQKGTGHALHQALKNIEGDVIVLVLYADVPLLQTNTINALLNASDERTLAWMTATVPDPHGFGRLVRDATGDPVAIVEEKDCHLDELKSIREINTGILAGPAHLLRQWTQNLNCNNSQDEYYLTDCLSMAIQDGIHVNIVRCPFPDEILGINDLVQLSFAEKALNRRRVERLMASGVLVHDPDSVYVRGTVTTDRDVEIDIGVILEGHVVLEEGCYLGPYTRLANCHIAKDARIYSHSVLDEAIVGQECQVGPFAHIRPGTRLMDGVKVGNFVEIKSSEIEKQTKINHLSYIGDAQIGKHVNIGAGTITCNYDGLNKHKTRIGDQVFIGSNSALVAPIEISNGSTVGAGSVIVNNVPEDHLSLSRAKQRNIAHWIRPKDRNKKGNL